MLLPGAQCEREQPCCLPSPVREGTRHRHWTVEAAKATELELGLLGKQCVITATRSPQHTPQCSLSATMLAASWVSPQGLSTQRNTTCQKSLIFRVQVILLWLLGVANFLVGCLSLYSSAHDVQMKLCLERVPRTGLASDSPQLWAEFAPLIPGSAISPC